MGLILFSLIMLARESYGEDIDNTESEAFDNNDDEYEYDSFIDDDDDPEIFPDSPVSEGESMYNTVVC